MPSSDLLWYAAYGSNLDPARFDCYLRGGCPPGATRTYPGTRDAAAAQEPRATRIPGQVVFGWDSPTWGGMIAQGRQIIHHGWWVLTFPLIVLFITVLAFNQLGDGLRRAIDPVMRR